MTFEAIAAWQAWLVLAAAAALAAVLFLIKVRPPRLYVSSMLLWRRVLDESREQTLWERIRRAVSLAVTVLIAVLLALAVMRPSPGTLSGTPVRHGRLLIVLDSSWSMLGRTRSGETRWDRAVAEARRLAAAASGEVALATTRDGLVEGPTSDRLLLEAALGRLSPSGGSITSWPRLAGASPLPIVHFITDGAVARPLEPGVIIHSVFEPAANVAITAFDVRRPLAGGDAGEAYLEVANYAPAAQQLRITLIQGATPLIDRKVDMAPGESLRQILPIRRGGDATLRAHVDAADNALGADDEAFGWIQRARPTSVAVVGTQTAWIASLFEGNPNVRAAFVHPSAYPDRTDRADAIVFDRWAPPDPPRRPALYLGPPTETPWLADGEGRPPVRASARAEQHPQWDTPGSHPVVRGVDPFTLTIERARPFASPALIPVARSSRGTPLVYISESPDRRFVVVAFGANDSNLASAPGFPVLIGNALDWLTQPAADAARSRIPANIGSPQISNLTRTTLGATAQAHAVAPGASSPSWWIACAIAAFALALAEWWTWLRRITV